ncbi:hypothetical protein [Pseudonocardia sp. HH130629-09]|uniref:hypothetical protein n=1 Tax=Pseudonocardia sp. HH130629-09 TaxID=1641402 RepID=UPI000AC5C1EC|nr:hypothetical protein [Pseudonocardia sp. HH130629-09]
MRVPLPGLRAVTTTAGVLAVAAVVVHLVVVRPAQQIEQARTDGLAAARTLTEQVLSYRPASRDADLARARGLVTGDFGRQFGTVLDSVVGPALDRGVGTRTTVTGPVSSTPSPTGSPPCST